MQIPFHQVDAFVVDGRPLTGNPAAVMLLDEWLPNATLQAIAVENNLSETAFLKRSDGAADWDLRWFTPATEVDLCGHATIASAHVVIGDSDAVTFQTRSGLLTASRSEESIVIDLPAADRFQVLEDAALANALGVEPAEMIKASGAEDCLVALLENEAAVRAVTPDFHAMRLWSDLVVVTAPGDDTDIASRVFAVGYGIDEDPVTGAAHAAIVPWWAQRLGKEKFTAIQASARGGQIHCTYVDDRVRLGGRCASVIEGTFLL
ncbi:PhzF family phenazine biosynthesis protein [Sphingomicrobium marinum]|uniref:PhzF family phenazine biosynthesis protein n=1 Tax=Sphingomicrobium marinum TaxID=1227950 RepID=UPI0022402C6F|nr:PhzF family phenazine biosynthesis protein [Sphingomicrobium marinum]